MLNSFMGARKDLGLTASKKMKQLQWEKVPHQAVGKTLWQSEAPDKEHEWLMKLQMDGIWRQMEDDFMAKQQVINLMGMYPCQVSTGAALMRYSRPPKES